MDAPGDNVPRLYSGCAEMKTLGDLSLEVLEQVFASVIPRIC